MKKKLLLTLRGYKVLRGLIPGFLPTAAARAAFAALLPFVNIIASAMVIDALSAKQPFESVLLIALAAAGINFAALAASHLFKRVAEYTSAMVWRTWEIPLNERQQDMDFARIEEPETRLLRQTIRTQRETMGAGILLLQHTFEDLVRNFLTVVFSVGVFAPVLASSGSAGGLWGFLNTPWFAALFPLILLANTLFGMLMTSKRARRAHAVFQGFQQPNALGNYMIGRFMEKYQLGKDLKVNGLRGCVDHIVAALFAQFEVPFARFGAEQAKYQSYTDIAANALSLIVYVFVAVKAVLGSLGVGGIVQYVGGITRFNAGFTGLAYTLGHLSANVEALENYFAFLDQPDKIYHGTIPVEKRSDNEYEVEFKGVGFRYPGTERWALRGLNLKLRVGQRLAVVGMNGSGKTTMIKLLCRLYDPTEGEITLNGIDIRKYDYKEYMDIFSVVFQDFKLFSFPLGQNVAASSAYDAAKVRQCLERAGAAKRLQSLPKGLETSLYKDFDEEGVEVSGGEAQKIAIARALYKDAPFIVLDEPTAALDPIAEAEIYATLNDIVENRTAIFISHRLSSCRFCDDIAVFHEGRLAQRGGHDALLADAGGKYGELWRAQAQYYTEHGM